MDDSPTTLPPTLLNPSSLPPDATAYDPQRTADFQVRADAQAAPDLPSVPGFVLEQELGRGGMGVVYRARQLPLGRTVALKMILAGDHASPDIKVRFLAEAEAIAKVMHPGIVQVYAFGTHQGHPYFALEYVDGGSLASLLTYRTLSPTDAAGLTEKLAQAVQAAHVQGIIHRDLKPANVLLSFSRAPQARASEDMTRASEDMARAAESEARDFTEEARACGARLNDVVPKITDFGLAKQLDAGPGLTATGAVMGTPSYMAPEQAEGRLAEVRPATDVYSLGAILYECLTGRPPFKGATALDTLDMVLRQEPVAVRQLQPVVPRDLETICHKCLRKEPAQRYGTAQALAEDLRNFLDGKPILARPVGWLERAVKWCRRYPAVAALLLVSILSAVVATILAVWAVAAEQQAVDQARRADQERDAKEVQRQQAEQARAAEAALRKRAEQAEADLFADYQTSTDEVIENLIGSRPDLGPNERAYLERTVQRWQAYADRQGTSPRGRWIRANGYFHMGLLWQRLGRTAEAEREYGFAQELCAKLVTEFPDMLIYRRDLANCHGNQALLLVSLGRHAEAETAFRAALALQQPLVDRSDYAEYRMNLATMYTNLGCLLTDLNRSQEAEAACRTALQLRQRLVQDHPEFPDFQWQVAESHINLGYALEKLNQPQQVEATYQAALPILERLVKEYPASPKYRNTLSKCLFNLGSLHARQGQWKEAEACYRTVLHMLERLVTEYPAFPHYRQELGRSWSNLGDNLRQRGQVQDAIAAYQAAQKQYERLVADHPRIPAHRLFLAHVHNNLGLMLADVGQVAEAEKSHRAALALRQKLAADAPGVPEHRQGLALSHMNLGIFAFQRNQLTEAEAHWNAACQLQEQLRKDFPDNPAYAVEMGGTYCNLGNLASRRDDLAVALDWYDKAITLLAPQATAGVHQVQARQNLGNTHWGRAILLEKQSRYAQADVSWDQAGALCHPANKAPITRQRDEWKAKRKN